MEDFMERIEALSALRVLGAVAQADGKVDPSEVEALRHALADWAPEMPDGVDVVRLLSEPVDLDAELARIKTPVARRAVFESAIAMALADGMATEAENGVLSRIRETLGSSARSTLAEQSMQQKPEQWGFPSGPVLDPDERARRVSAYVRQRASRVFLYNIIPLPILTGLLSLLEWDRMIDGIALIYGHPLTRGERAARFGGVLGMAMLGSTVHSLLHVAPFIGSAVAASAGYAVTIGLGYAVDATLRSEGKATKAEIAKAYADGKQASKKALAEDKAQLEEQSERHRLALSELSHKLETNEIDLDEYERGVTKIINGE
jgi:hypothetical protein